MRNHGELRELLDAIDIGYWLDREGVEYRPTMGSRGPQYNIKHCPVCGNSSWKVYLNQESGLGNCFAGDHPPGQNFNKWRFIRAQLSGSSTPMVVEHIRQIAREHGWRPARIISASVEMENMEVELPPSFELPIKGKHLAYLANRDIGIDLARYFHLRYCHKGNYRYRVAGDWRFQDYSGRVIIPIFDLDGKLVTFQGRDITGSQDPKYLFPPGLTATGKHLFNGLNVHTTKRIVVGEGAFDVMALKVALDVDPALRDVVPIGTFGKHLSHGSDDDQNAKFAILRARGVEDVTMMWDGEVPATDAAILAGRLLLQHGFKVRIGMLPAGKDPNEVAPDVVRRCYYEAMPLEGAGYKIMMRRRTMNS
jgi:DNA primase